jgi:Icc-related predicted phosphoesterase
VIRVAAVGDVHFAQDAAGTLRPALAEVNDDADVLLLAGDLTRVGHPEEAEVLADELRDVRIPMVAVLGNHDYHADRHKEVSDVLAGAGVRVLEGDAVTLDVGGRSLGIAGVKGFGNGFPGASAGDFGEPEMKAFVGTAREAGDRLREALESLDTDLRIALMHYAPVEDTLRGERLEIWPFLGSYFLAEAVDAAGADLAVHGHAHGGTEKGMTPGGVHVRNVAQAVIRSAYRVYCLSERTVTGC